MAKKTKIDIIIEELQNASKMHLRQSKELSSHVDDMGSPAKQTASDAISMAGNFLKGAGGVAASILSTTSAEAGQKVRSQAQFDKENPANKNIVHDGGKLPNKNKEQI